MEKQQQQKQEIQIQDRFPGAEYANMMQVGHTKDEFLMTFINLVPPSGRVVGKIMTTPGHLKRIIRALQENLEKYESQNGTVEEADQPRSEIGFNAQ